MSNQTSFEVCQTLPEWNGGGIDVLWQFSNEEDAQYACDTVNTALAERGIPSSVSCAFVR
jgi:hypothetical protein